MTKTIQNPHGIKTPTNVDEFRENLKKYYVTLPRHTEWGDGGKMKTNLDEHPLDKWYLYIQEKEIPLSEIESFGDVYDITKTGFLGNGSSPSILPKIELKKDLREFMKETNQFFGSDGYFEDESNFSIIGETVEDQDDFLVNGNPMWFTLDNQWLREFYMMTLGEFSGYVYKVNEDEMLEEVV